MRANKFLGIGFAWLVGFGSLLRANELLSTPEPKPDAVAHYILNEQRKAEQPKFYSKEAKITLAAEIISWGLDLGFTCNNLAHGGREVNLPANDCARIIGLTAGFHVAGEGLAYLLHRTGHHRLEQAPRWYLTANSFYGAAFSAVHAHATF
jgi:hypothetical protein